MNANIIDGRTYQIKQVVQYEDYLFRWDIDYTHTSTITTLQTPNIAENDYIVAFDEGGEIVFQGICRGIQQAEGGIYTISMVQIECLFDRDLILKNEDVAAASGIEAFIVKTIQDNFSAAGDSWLDLAYLQASSGGDQTPYTRQIQTEQGIYNLKTLLGNLKENDGLFTRFTFGSSQLQVLVDHPAFATYNMNLTGVSDVFEVDETYSIDVLARLNVKWKIPDQDYDGIIGATTYPSYYFTSTGKVTRVPTTANRILGRVDAVYIAQETYEGMLETVSDEFRNQNSYGHKIEAKIYSRSKAYPFGDLFVGRPVGLRSRGRNLTSIITAVEKASGQPYYKITFGTLPVYLTDKLKRRR